MEDSHPETNHQNSTAGKREPTPQSYLLTSMSEHGIHTSHKHILYTYMYITLGKLQEQKPLQRVEAGGIWGQSGPHGEILPNQTISKQWQTQLIALLQKTHFKGKEERRQRERERRGGREGKKGREREKNLLLPFLRPWEIVIGRQQSTDKYLGPTS